MSAEVVIDAVEYGAEVQQRQQRNTLLVSRLVRHSYIIHYVDERFPASARSRRPARYNEGSIQVVVIRPNSDVLAQGGD